MGGGAMRAAAKTAGIGVASGSLRGVPVLPSAESSVRNVQRPVSVSVLSQGGKSVDTAPAEKSMGATSWDDWDFAGEDELFLQSPRPMNRVVFGGVPSFDEAKEATDELKDALDKVYLSSPNSAPSVGSVAGNDDSGISASTKSVSETKSCVIETIIAPSVPQHALQAFRLLSTSLEAQTVVASIASDPKVWNAMMDNPVLKDFFHSHQTSSGSQPKEWNEDCEESYSSSSNSNDPGKENGFSFIFEFMENIRLSVVDLACNVSNFLQSLFQVPAAAEGDGENSKSNSMGSVYTGAFMGLAVLVAMVVLLKRV